MQRELARIQEELANEVVEATAGGGAIRVQVTGQLEFKGIEIKPEVVDPEDVEMLQDLIMAATRDAFARVGAEVAKSTPEELSKRLVNDLARWRKVQQMTGLKLD